MVLSHLCAESSTPTTSDDRQPFVSVILPVRNEGAGFAETLGGVRDQDYPRDRFEVLVVDGMSEDDTRAVTTAFSRDDPRVRLLDNPGRIVPTAMNIGIAAAKGDIVVRVDGHTRIARDYVRRSVEALNNSGAQCAGGRMDAEGDTFIGRLVAAATGGMFGVGNSHFHYAEEARYTETVYMGAWPRETLLRVGGFDEEMVRNQDDELNYRIRRLGGRVYLDPRIKSVYRPRGDLRGLWRQYFQYGYWKVRVFQKHPTMLRARHFVPAAFVAVGTMTAIASLFLPLATILFGTGLLIYLGAAFLASSSSGLSLVERFAMPAVYFVIHASYGSGFLAGLVRFLPRWFAPEAPKTPLRRAQSARPATNSERG